MSPSPRTFLVECFWPGVNESQLTAAAERVADDQSVICHELILVCADEIVLGLFQARSETAIAEATCRAGLPSERIVESIRVHPASHDIGAGHDRRRIGGDVAGPSDGTPSGAHRPPA
jgi:hypothetical protein